MKSAAELLSQQFGAECGYGEEETDYYWKWNVLLLRLLPRIFPGHTHSA